MEIVIDTSAILAVITGEPHRPAILAATQGATLRAPTSLHWEIGNAFSAMIKRRRITRESAIRAIALYEQIPIAFTEVDLDQAVTLAARQNIYAYDAYVLICAQQFALPLISLDAALVRAAAAIGLGVIDV
ncbi:MAG: type II toxin-antitoxin system VapC family toxin [Terriglobales bacterium]|jgi:predicted nucleic acid-binding protein